MLFLGIYYICLIFGRSFIYILQIELLFILIISFIKGANEMSENVSFLPNKRLFIDIMTQDIDIYNCIMDLIDNSVDSYTINNIQEKRTIKIEFSKSEFYIYDNCGGVDRDHLLKEVFRFGAKDFSRPFPTIGIYGIGLKRSIFKLGKNIIFETDNGEHYSKLIIDVDDWAREENKWEIPLHEDSGESRLNQEKPYTRILVKELNDEIKEQLNTEFEDNLRKKIKHYYSYFTDNRIDFFYNKEKIERYYIEISHSDEYNPIKNEGSFNGVNYSIICWVELKEKQDIKRETYKLGNRGWQVFMNKRLILLDDTSEDTGWIGYSPYLPRYHPIYNDFRGVVYIDSEDPSKLPVNTYKSEFNKETIAYKNIILKMCEIARPIINHLSDKYEYQLRQSEDVEESIEEAARDSSGILIEKSSIDEIEFSSSFQPPAIPKSPPMTSIQYEKPRELVYKARKLLGVRSNKEVGIKTFNFFVESQEIEE